jgi:type II secretory pathway predicted ATPase ExeA/septal ring-binding cell division protein DamX
MKTVEHPGTAMPEDLEGAAHSLPAQDPFDALWRQSFWYNEAVREKRLNLLVHLAPYSAALLLSGDAGSGKTTLLHQFLARANDTWQICHIQGAADITRSEILNILDQELSLHSAAEADEEERIRRLRDSLHMLRRGSLVPIAVIDDAHLLPQDALEMLGRLADPREDGEILLGLILAGEPPIEERFTLPGLGTLRERVSHTFDLPPFGEEATADYIRHRLRIAGCAPDGPFTPAVMKFIHVASRGIPGRINELARGVLRNETRVLAGSDSPATRSLAHRTLLHYGIAALAISLVVVALFYQDTLKQYSRVGPVPVVADPPPPAPPTAIEQEQITSSEGSVAPPLIAVVPDPEPPAGEILTETGRDTGPAEPEVAPPATGAETEPAATQLPVTAPGPQDAAWLLAQSPEHFTLQLIASSEERARMFIAQHGLEDGAALFRSAGGERPLFAVVYGVYPSRQAAGQELESPPIAAIPGVEPWIRPLRDVQRIIGSPDAQ